MPKNRAYEDATWAWVKKSVPVDRLEVRVLIWGEDGEQAHELHHTFDADIAGERAAVAYATACVEAGARLACIERRAPRLRRSADDRVSVIVESRLVEPVGDCPARVSRISGVAS